MAKTIAGFGTGFLFIISVLKLPSPDFKISESSLPVYHLFLAVILPSSKLIVATPILSIKSLSRFTMPIAPGIFCIELLYN